MGSTTAALAMALALVWVTPTIAAGQEPATHPNDVTGDAETFGGCAEQGGW